MFIGGAPVAHTSGYRVYKRLLDMSMKDLDRPIKRTYGASMNAEVLCKAGHGGLQQTLYRARHLSEPMAMRVETSLACVAGTRSSSLHRLLAFSR